MIRNDGTLLGRKGLKDHEQFQSREARASVAMRTARRRACRLVHGSAVTRWLIPVEEGGESYNLKTP